jgi:LacI family transcriptional regulator
MPVATLREVAKKTGFSISVVSRTLNRHPDKNARVSPQTRRIIEKAAKTLDFHPNRAAEFLRRGSAPTIGVFLPKIADHLIAELVIGVAEEAKAQGFPLSFSFDMTAAAYTTYVAGAKDVAHCGIITYPFNSDGGQWPDNPQQIGGILGEFRKAGGNVVLVDALTPVEGVPNVACDDYEGGRLAAARLLERQCKLFFHVDPYWGRTTGFAETLRASGKEVRQFSGDPDAIAELARAIQDVQPRDLPIGVFANGDAVAVRMLSALGDAPKWRVGRDLLVVGYDAHGLGEELAPPLTSIRQPFEEMGRIAVKKVINLIYGQEETSQQLKPFLVPRGSA